MHVPSLIEKKRDGQELTAEEIDFLVSGFTHGEIPEYQMSAWADGGFFSRDDRGRDAASHRPR